MTMQKTMQKITAIIPLETQTMLVDALREHGVPGVSISQVKGYGEYVNTYSTDSLETMLKVEIYTLESAAIKIAELIVKLTQTGVAGDGIIAITPVDTFVRIRDKMVL